MKQLLNQRSNQLQQLLSKTCELDTLHNTLQAYLPSELAQHVWVANFRQGCLVLATASAAWGTQLRYLLPQIRESLRRDGILPNLTDIKYIVSPTPPPPTRKPWHTPTLTSTSRQQIANDARSLPTELQQALLRLANKNK